uniref:Uncharacterized protein n=1 Tax=Naja naja TaxID=35670 RepID=A0A8C6YKC4_NAJNA
RLHPAFLCPENTFSLDLVNIRDPKGARRFSCCTVAGGQSLWKGKHLPSDLSPFSQQPEYRFSSQMFILLKDTPEFGSELSAGKQEPGIFLNPSTSSFLLFFTGGGERGEKGREGGN